MRVILADDDRVLRRFIARALRRGGHEVEEADDAEGLVAALRASAPDAVLSDIEMPGDGLSACRLLRAGGSKVRFLLMTGSEERALEAEAAGFETFRKPFDLDRLLSWVSG